MKIILSESQIVYLLKEAYGKEKYIDTLLDKMSGRGLSALSNKEREDLEKMSRGEEIDFGEPQVEPDDEPENDVLDPQQPAQEMFMEMVPQMYRFDVDGEPWHFAKEVAPDGDGDVLIVIKDTHDISFMIIPFSNDREFKVTTSIRDYDFKIKEKPKTPEEMKIFIEKFIKVDLKTIVKYIKNKQ